MTDSIVIDLQKDALSEVGLVSNLLRKAKVVAVKLDLPDFQKWIDGEFNGFEDDPPDYRIVRGAPKGFNQLFGWIALNIPVPDIQLQITRCVIGQPIASLERLAEDGGEVFFPYPPHMMNAICHVTELPLQRAGLVIDKSQIVGILAAVRTAVLDWSLKLEKAGIVGENYSFSEREKEKAHQPSININIKHLNNMSGLIGSATTGASVTSHQNISVDSSEVKKLIEQISKLLPVAELSPRKENEARELISGIRSEISQPIPNDGKIRGMLNTLKRVIEGAASKIVADGIVSNIEKIL